MPVETSSTTSEYGGVIISPDINEDDRFDSSQSDADTFPLIEGLVEPEQATIYPIHIGYSNHVINVRSGQSTTPHTITFDDKYHIALFTAHSERLGVYLMTDPWITAGFLARQAGDEVNTHAMRASLGKLVDIGAVETVRFWGYRLKVPIPEVKDMLLSKDDYTLPNGVDNLWEIPGMVPHLYAPVLPALIDYIDQHEGIVQSEHIDALLALTGCQTASGVKKLFASLRSGKHPVITLVRTKGRYEYHLTNPVFAREFVKRQKAEYFVIPELVHSTSDEDRSLVEAPPPLYSYVKYSPRPVHFKTPKLRAPMILSSEFLRRLGYLCAAVELRLKRSITPALSINDLVQTAAEEVTYSEFIMLTNKLKISGIIASTGSAHIPLVSLEALKALAQGNSDFPFPVPQTGLWENRRLFHETETHTIREVANIIRANGQFITNQHAQEIADKLDITIKHLEILLARSLSVGPRSPFIRLNTASRFAVYVIRASEIPIIDRISRTSQMQTRALVLPSGQCATGEICQFKHKPTIGNGYTQWADLGFRLEAYPKNPGTSDLKAVAQVLEAPLTETRVSSAFGNYDIYVGPFPGQSNIHVLKMLSWIGITSPETLADLVYLASNSAVTLGDMVRSIEGQYPKHPLVIQLKRRVAQIATSKKVGVQRLHSLRFDDVVALLHDKLAEAQEHHVEELAQTHEAYPEGLESEGEGKVDHADEDISRRLQKELYAVLNGLLPEYIGRVERIFRSDRGGYHRHINLEAIIGSSALYNRRNFQDIWNTLDSRKLAHVDNITGKDPQWFVTPAGTIILKLCLDNQTIRKVFDQSQQTSEQQINMLTKCAEQIVFGYLGRAQQGKVFSRTAFLQQLACQFFQAVE